MCRESSTIMDGDEEREQDGARVRVRGVAGHVDGDEAGEQDGHISESCGDHTRDKSRRLFGAMSTSCRLRCWTPPDDLVRASAMDLD